MKRQRSPKWRKACSEGIPPVPDEAAVLPLPYAVYDEGAGGKYRNGDKVISALAIKWQKVFLPDGIRLIYATTL